MLDLEPALDELARIGFTGVDLWQVSPYYDGKGHVASDAPAAERQRVRRLAADRGLELQHLASYPGLAFAAESESERRRDLAWAKETIRLCADLAMPVMRVAAGRGETLDHLPTVAPLLKEAADCAAGLGVRLCLETHHGLPTCRADWIAAVLDAVGSPNLGVLYDPANLAPDNAYKDVPRLLADRIFHVHIKNVYLDADGRKAVRPAFPPLGAADIQWVLKALADAGYDGNFAVEFEPHKPDCSVDEARKGLTQWLDFLKAH